MHQLDWLSFLAGLTSGALVAVAAWIHDDPPEFIAKWGRGAEAEARTETALKPLLQEGWKVRHDIYFGRGNADHVLRSPTGIAYLLETKALAGQISIEQGIVVCRFVDDPDERRHHDLRRTMRFLTERVASEWTRRQGHAAPQLRPIVVLWGVFPQRVFRTGEIAYVAGDELATYLRAQEEAGTTRLYVAR